MHWTYKAFTEDLHFCLYAAPCPKSTPGLLSNFPLTSATFSLAAFYIFFQMESLLRLPLVSLMFPFSGHRRSFSIVFLLSGRIWQLFEFSCTAFHCWSCFFPRRLWEFYGYILFGRCLVFEWWYLSPFTTQNHIEGLQLRFVLNILILVWVYMLRRFAKFAWLLLLCIWRPW